ncbi:Uncharacterised protein [Mycobacteroides abscessus]|nr:Uncharacterised protein [Mycobacteroides abscessus]
MPNTRAVSRRASSVVIPCAPRTASTIALRSSWYGMSAISRFSPGPGTR